MPAEWSRLTNTTINQYLRDEQVNIMRHRVLPAMLDSRGQIEYGGRGLQLDWKVRYKRVAMTGYADMDPINIARQDQWKTAQLDWRAYVSGNAVSKKEKLENRGQEAIINIVSGIVERLVSDMKDQFAEEYYVDGNAAANVKRMHGIESFGGYGSAADTGYYLPSDSFAGLTTDPGTYGGSWTGTWPNGYGDPQYDFWSPIIVDYTDTTWTGTATWASACVEAIAAGILASQRSASQKGMLDLIIMTSALFKDLKAKNRANERIVVDRGSDSELVSLGFKNVINIDGVDCTWEYGGPSGVAYGINIDSVKTHSMQDQMFVGSGPHYNELTQADNFTVDFYGNTTWNPRDMVFWKNI